MIYLKSNNTILKSNLRYAVSNFTPDPGSLYPGLVAFYKLEDNMTDETGDYDGLSHAEHYTTGKIGKCLSKTTDENGTEYGRLPSSLFEDNMSSGDDWSMVYWWKTNTVWGIQRIASMNHGGGSNEFQIIQNKYKGYWVKWAGSLYFLDYNNTSVEWTYQVIRYSSGVLYYDLWNETSKLAAATFSVTINLNVFDNMLLLTESIGGNDCLGNLDQFMFFNKKIDDTEIATLYNSGSGV